MAKNVVVVGAQWGDEGKGKIVDWLTEKVDGVVRFNGTKVKARLLTGLLKKWTVWCVLTAATTPVTP